MFRDLFSFFTVLIFILGLTFLINRAGNFFRRAFLCFLAIQSSFFSFYSILAVFNLSFQIINPRANDALILQRLTLVPAPFWSIFWALSSILLFLLTLKILWQRQ